MSRRRVLRRPVRGCGRRPRGFGAAAFPLFQLGVGDYAEGQRPRSDRPAGGLLRQSLVIFQTLGQPRQKQVARHGVLRRQQVEGHALAERAHENVYLLAVCAAQVAQQPLTPARVAAQPRPVPGYQLLKCPTRRVIHNPT